MPMSSQARWLAIIVFIASLFIHVRDLNSEGRTWDEQYKIDTGYAAILALWEKNFSEITWNQGIEHPMVAKYIYGLASLADRRTFKIQIPLSSDQLEYVHNGNYFYAPYPDRIEITQYDLTYSRLVSAIANSFTVLLTYMIGLSFVAPVPMALGALALATTPRFLAMGRLVTFESLTGLWYLITIILFARLTVKNQDSLRWYIGVGIGVGLMLWTRYNNTFVLLFLFGWWWLRHRHLSNPSLLIIPLVAILVGFITWPLLWMRFPHYVITSLSQNVSRAGISLYHMKYWYATTPVVYFAFSLLGFWYALRQRGLSSRVLVWAILSTISLYIFFASERGHTRYMFILYPPYGVCIAIGFTVFYRWFSRIFTQYQSIVIIFLIALMLLYQTWILSSIHPYYLDYYAEQVGGIQGATSRGYEVYWWGEGQREAGMWLRDHAKPGETIALQVSPKYVFPRMKWGVTSHPFGEHIDGSSTYLVVSRSDLMHVPMNVLSLYDLVYVVQRDNVPLVMVYKQKSQL